jgi:hypothetical protein
MRFIFSIKNNMIKTIKNIQALSAFKQNRLNQKLSKLSVALAGAEFVHFAHCADQLTQDETCVLFFPARINVEYHLPWTTKARLCQGVA